MSRSDVRLIVNPHSGTRSKSSLPELLVEALAPRGLHVSVRETSAPGDAARFASEAVDDGCNMVAVAGGDGTVNEAGSALIGTDLPLALLPCGSGNGLARSLGLSTDLRDCIRVIAEGTPRAIDCGMVGNRPFFCTFGMGFDAAVTEKFSMAGRRGRATYVRSALLEFLHFKPQSYAIRIGGNIITERALIVAVCNASQYGNNAYIAPYASLCDGQLDVTVIHDGPLLMQAVAGVQLLSGRIDRNILVETFRTPSVEISRLDDAPAHIDGELFRPGRRIEIKCYPSALNVIADKNADRPFKPIATPIASFFRDILVDIKTNLGVGS